MKMDNNDAKLLGYIFRRWRTSDGCIGYQEAIDEIRFGSLPTKKLLDFEAGKDMDFRVMWGMILDADDFLVTLTKQYGRRFLDPEWVNEHLTMAERSWLTEFRNRVRGQGIVTLEGQKKVYVSMLNASINEGV